MQLFGAGDRWELVPTEGSWIGLGRSIHRRIQHGGLEHVDLLDLAVGMEPQRAIRYIVGQLTNQRAKGVSRWVIW